MKVLRALVRVDAGWTVTIHCAGQPVGEPRVMRRATDAEGFVFPLPPAGEPLAPGHPAYALCSVGTADAIAAAHARIHGRDLKADDVVAFGAWMFEALIGEARFQGILARADAEGAELIELALAWPSDDRHLHRLNWEMMCRQNDAGAAVFLASGSPRRIAITRIAQGAAQGARPVGSPPRILFVLGEAFGGQELRAGAEVVGMLQQIKAQEHAIVAEIIPAATPSRITRATRSFKPDVVHFVCHGGVDAEGRTYLDLPVDEKEASPQRYAEQIVPWLAADKGALPPIVVLSACESGAMLSPRETAPLAAELVARGVPIVIAMAGTVSDVACRLFTRRLGEALVLGQPILAATEEGRRAAFTEGPVPSRSADWAFPAVFLAEGVPPEIATTPPVAGAPPAVIAQRIKTYGVEAAPVFCARYDLLETFRRVIAEERPALVVYGKAGASEIGQSRLLKELTARAIRDGHVPCPLIFEAKPSMVPRPTTVEQLARMIGGVILKARRTHGLPGRALQIALLGAEPPAQAAQNAEVDPEIQSELLLNPVLDANVWRLALQRDLADLMADARARDGALVTAASRAVLLLDDIHDYGDALEPLLRVILGPDGLRANGERVTTVLTCTVAGAREPTLRPAIENKIGPDWVIRPIDRFREDGEDMLVYERVLLHPHSHELEPGVSGVPWVFNYNAPGHIVARWEQKFRRRIEGIAGKMMSDRFYLTVEDASHDGFTVHADDEAILLHLRQGQGQP